MEFIIQIWNVACTVITNIQRSYMLYNLYSMCTKPYGISFRWKSHKAFDDASDSTTNFDIKIREIISLQLTVYIWL